MFAGTRPSEATCVASATVGIRRGRRLWSVAGLAAFVALIPVALLVAQRPAASASTILTVFTDTVFVASSSNQFVAARDGDPVRVGDSLRTDNGGHALITFFDGSTLELEPATIVRVEAATTNPNGSITIALTQTIGRSWASVQKLTRVDSKFEIKTPAATAAVRGTAFLTEVLADGTTRIETSEGTVEVSAQGQSVLVGAGQTTSVQVNAPPTRPVSMRAPVNLIRFGMHSPAYLTVVDPIGRACGLLASGAMVRHIPGCVVTPPGTEPQLIDVPEARTGTYQMVIAPIGEGGAFTLTATGVEGAGAVAFDRSLSGTVRTGVMLGSTIGVQVSADGLFAAGDLEPLVTLSAVPVKAITPAGSAAPASSSTPNVAVVRPSPTAPASPTAAPSAPPTSPLPASPSPTPGPSGSPLPSDSASLARTASPSPTPRSQLASPSATPRPEPSQTVVAASSPSQAAAPTSNSTTRPGSSATPTPTPTETPRSEGTAPPAASATPKPTRTVPHGASVCSVMSDERCRFSRDSNESAISSPTATSTQKRDLPRGASVCSVMSDERCRFSDSRD